MAKKRPENFGELDEIRSELDFGTDDDRDGRAGDRRSLDESSDEFPVERVREAGRSGGETVDGHITADDLSPETLLHEARAGESNGLGVEPPADTQLREVDESKIGGGRGKDEAELALWDSEKWNDATAGRGVSVHDVARGDVAAVKPRRGNSPAAKVKRARKNVKR